MTNGANEIFAIESMSNKIRGQGVEQFLIAARIGAAKIIDWLDNALTEEVIPDAIDGIACEVGIVRPSQPAASTSRRSSVRLTESVSPPRKRGDIVFPVRGCTTSPWRAS